MDFRLTFQILKQNVLSIGGIQVPANQLVNIKPVKARAKMQAGFFQQCANHLGGFMHVGNRTDKATLIQRAAGDGWFHQQTGRLKPGIQELPEQLAADDVIFWQNQVAGGVLHNIVEKE